MGELDEPVVVVGWDRAWTDRYASERARLADALRPLDAVIEHIGSTAVVGLAAKPVIDILVGADEVDRAARAVQALGYERLGEAGVAGRVYLRLRGGNDVNVHVFSRDSQMVRDNLVLRDYLRAHPAEVTAYGHQKRRLVAAGHDSLLTYSAAKHDVVAALVESARRWDRAGRPPGR